VRKDSDAEEPRLDLSPIDPDRDPVAADRFVNEVMARIGTRPVPAAMPDDPLVGIWSLMRSPALAAGIVIAAALGAYGLVKRNSSDRPQTIAQAMGVPAEFLVTFDPPTTRPDSR
jgi:hypothetical protein